ncbi:hypothetical protein [Rivularia sp. UHCC 0363]|uniref:hypothetical protein n=1 Tax=Rivularia sp. UHCC 0363 TaxID=3110244 RepID=UPI002B1F3048|nr:hypothetical protein [Rivularia sp. UHCC 0363]MEA5595703.1 hypothetical protein [Rivularia sp. UHCC 0363]
MFKYFIFLLIIFYQSPVFAQQSTAFKDENNTLFLYGLNPNQPVEIEFKKPIHKAFIADECGLVTINSDDVIQFESQVITPNFNFEIKELPKTCTELATYPQIFKIPSGAIAARGIPNKAYKITYPNHEIKRQIVANECGFIQIRNFSAPFLNLPTVTKERADFAFADLPVNKPLACLKNKLYFPVGFDPRTAVASAVGASNLPDTAPPSNTVNSQNAQPVATKSGNFLIITGIPPGDYTVANASNPAQKKNYTVTSKACLVSDRTTIGSPNDFLVSRQGLTFPISWNNLQTVSTVPVCK